MLKTQAQPALAECDGNVSSLRSCSGQFRPTSPRVSRAFRSFYRCYVVVFRFTAFPRTPTYAVPRSCVAADSDVRMFSERARYRLKLDTLTQRSDWTVDRILLRAPCLFLSDAATSKRFENALGPRRIASQLRRLGPRKTPRVCRQKTLEGIATYVSEASPNAGDHRIGR